MKKIAAVLVIAIMSTPVLADEYVNGYYRQNGTYVQPHYQTAPDNTVYNNYSTRGNVNPYTGQPGYVNPQPSPAPQQPNNAYTNYGYSNGLDTPLGGRRR